MSGSYPTCCTYVLLLWDPQKICHNCGSPQSTQTSVGHMQWTATSSKCLPACSVSPSLFICTHAIPHVPANAPVSQPSTPYPQTSQLSFLTPQTTPYPHSSRPSHHHIPQAASRPHTHQPPSLSFIPLITPPLPHVPQATPNPSTFQPPPPPPPPPPASPSSHIPQVTPHPHSQTGLTVQQQVFSATNRSPDSETFNSTRKRSS